MDAAEFHDRLMKRPDAFESCDTLDTYADAIRDTTKPGFSRFLDATLERHSDTWLKRLYATFKAHGFVSRALALPHARKVSDVFSDVSLYDQSSGNGAYRGQSDCERAGARFISTSRAPGFAYFDSIGADYSWSPNWIARGERLRQRSGGKNMLTGCKPSRALVDVMGPLGTGDFHISSFDAVRWSDGRILIVANRYCGIGSEWVAILDPGETAISMLSEWERGEIEAEQERQNAAWSMPEGEMRWWHVCGADRQRGALVLPDKFTTRVKAVSHDDACEVTRLQRYAMGREHVQCMRVEVAA